MIIKMIQKLENKMELQINKLETWIGKIQETFNKNLEEIKNCQSEISAYHRIALISHASKVMLNILQARLQQYMNREYPDVHAGFRKKEEPEIKLPTSTASSKK